VLVRLPDDIDRLSLRGTICEVQITSLAAHVFNEMSHDIDYKDHDCPPTPAELDSLAEVRYVTWLLDRSVERLVVDRAKAVRMQTVPLKNAEELQFALEQEANRRLHGEFVRLFRLLSTGFEPLTPAVFGSIPELLRQGEKRAEELGFTGADDVVHIALALFDDNAAEFEQVVREQRGPATLLKKAILKAAERKHAG
jgi:hypothetical protein